MTREDAYAILADGQLALPRSFVLASTERMWWRCGTTVMARPVEHCQSLTLITAMKRAKCAEGSAPIGWIFRELYAAIAFKLRARAPCAILALDTRVHVPSGYPNFIEVTAVGTVVQVSFLFIYLFMPFFFGKMNPHHTFARSPKYKHL